MADVLDYSADLFADETVSDETLDFENVTAVDEDLFEPDTDEEAEGVESSVPIHRG